MRYRILRTTFLAIMFASGMAACSDQSSSEQAAWYNRTSLYSYNASEGNLWDHMRQNLHMSDYTSSRAVRQQIRWYQTHPDHFNHIIDESAPYIYYIYQQTQQHKLPAELALIPVIESEYNPYAKSRTGALGLWQMMPSTASGFGLKRDWWYDGRKDVVASTQAALSYFTYLHDYFNENWLLAIAAYDCGEGTVTACVRYNRYHGRGTDFWDLPLPYETQNYVPRLLAVAAIVKDPSRYHLRLPPINDAPFVEQVNVGSPIALSKVATLAEVPLDTMKALNPGIQHGKTDPRGPFIILVPKEKAQSFKEKLAALTHNEKILWQEHVVKSKETLEKIAQKYRTTVALLKQVNGLKSDHVHPNQTLLIPPTTDTQLANNQNAEDNSAATNSDVAQMAVTQPIQQTFYQVVAGDNLWNIAQKEGVNINDLIAWNHLSIHHPLKAGEKLALQQPDTTTDQSQNNPPAQPQNSDQKQNSSTTNLATNTSSSPTDSSLAITYKVVKGDDLNKIAARFHTTTHKIKLANALSTSVLQPGQMLTIPTRKPKIEVAKQDNAKSTDTTGVATAMNSTAATTTTPNSTLPNNSGTTTNSTTTQNSPPSSSNTVSTTSSTIPKPILYTVRRGDYVEKIAKQFHVTTREILKWNRLSSENDIQPGQKLTIHTDA